jgi:hypothetical protein
MGVSVLPVWLSTLRRGRVETESNILHCTVHPNYRVIGSTSPTRNAVMSGAAAGGISIDSSERTATVNHIEFVINVDAILIAENGGNLYLPDGKVTKFIRCRVSAVAVSFPMANHYTDIYASYQPDIYPSSTDLSHLNSVCDEPSMPSQLGMSKDNRDLDTVQDYFNLMPYADTSTTPSPSSLGAPTSTEGPGPSSSPSFLLSDMLDVVHPVSDQTRKLRRDKPQINLAPDQPPTTQGRRRARVFVACLQWCAPSPYRGLIVVLIFFR